jgi:predicted DNA-binding WGR domain protein
MTAICFSQPKQTTNKPTPTKHNMTTPTIQAASLHYREGNSDKEYHAAIEPEGEGYIVTFSYGRRGNILTTGAKTPYPVSLHQATKVFDKLVASKLAKGYQYSSASAGETKPYQQSGDEGRDSGIRCQLLNTIDESEGLPASDLPAESRLESDAFHRSLLATLVEDLRNRIPLRQFEIFERVKLKHQSPQFVAEDLGMQRAMVDRNIHKAMTALRELTSHAEYQEEFYE